MVTEHLEEVQITQFVWPARSPDMNPIEYVWDDVGKCLRRHVPISGQDGSGQLRNILVQEWDNLPQNVIQNLIQSMPRCLQVVIIARGGNTSY
ncbi:hypothetical protein QE152_g21727 [Popillia japonica]|uniref:Tc1-like transposase DDE domain-containing protein n=1 Tax=Popillia japonica TaxID=7064 RepID=A0AAW1KP80_POPJA